VNILALVAGVVGGMLIWRLCATLNDRRDFANLEKERKQAQWNTVSHLSFLSFDNI